VKVPQIRWYGPAGGTESRYVKGAPVMWDLDDVQGWHQPGHDEIWLAEDLVYSGVELEKTVGHELKHLAAVSSRCIDDVLEAKAGTLARRREEEDADEYAEEVAETLLDVTAPAPLVRPEMGFEMWTVRTNSF
jgi:hypothetical protein